MKKDHFRLTYVAQKRLCLSSLLTVPNSRGPEQEFEVDIRFGLRKQPRFRDATLVYPRNDVWETSADIVMTRNYPVLNSVPSSVWNFCLSFSDVISRWNWWWRREMSAVFSGYVRFQLIFDTKWSLTLCWSKNLSSVEVRNVVPLCLYCGSLL